MTVVTGSRTGRDGAVPVLARVILVTSLRDELVEAAGLRVDGRYAERFWLPILGPTALWLLRRFAQDVGDSRSAEYDRFDLARSLGLDGGQGRNALLPRAVHRLEGFGMIRLHAGGSLVTRLLARTHVAPLPARYVARLPEALQVAHRGWREEP